MRPSNKSRSRNKPGNLGGGPGAGGGGNGGGNRRSVGNIINRVFESAGPDGKVRGTPQQIIDKYQALARDAQLAGDRVAAESFLQHSEHYSRLLGEAVAQGGDSRPVFDRDDAPREDGARDGYADQPREQTFREQPRDERPRDERIRDEPRAERPRDQAPREERLRDQAPREQRDAPRRSEPTPRPQPVIASSLDMIDPGEDGEFGGLIDTPESAGLRGVDPEPLALVQPETLQPESLRPEPFRPERGVAAVDDASLAEPAAVEPAVQKPAGEMNGHDDSPPAVEAVEAPKKRGRPRRKAPAPEGEPAPPIE